MKTALFIIILTFNTIHVIAQHSWTRTNPGGGGAIACVEAAPDGTMIISIYQCHLLVAIIQFIRL